MLPRTMSGQPQLSLLFCATFNHESEDIHVDEIGFQSSVLLSHVRLIPRGRLPHPELPKLIGYAFSPSCSEPASVNCMSCVLTRLPPPTAERSYGDARGTLRRARIWQNWDIRGPMRRLGWGTLSHR